MLDGPVINVTFAPFLNRAFAIEVPCNPLESFEIYLTGSILSLVAPDVTRIFLF